MNEEMEVYIHSLSINGTVLERIENAYERASQLCPEGLTELFVSEYITNDGQREWDSVWFRSNQYLLEANAFMTRDSVDIIMNSGNLTRLELTSSEYDFRTATDRSRLSMQAEWREEVSGVLKASGHNCDSLLRVAREWFLAELG